MTTGRVISGRAGHLAWLMVAGAAAAALIVHARLYLPFISDDALISLRYAQRLLAGNGLTWTDGPPVEGYSNLLWVLLCAAAGAVGFDLIVAARVLGVAGMVAAVTALAWTSRRRHAFPLLVALTLFVASAPIAVWSIGGMEQALVAALLAWAIALLYCAMQEAAPRRSVTGASVLLGLLCITRPDGFVFTVGALVAVVLVRGLKRDALVLCGRLIAFPLLLTAGQMVFRVWYYHDWLPNTARVKVAPSSTHLRGGLGYVAAGVLASAVLVGTATAVVRWAQRHKLVLLIALAAPWLGYLAIIGGDIFPAFRHMVPIVVVAAFAIDLGGQSLWERAGSRRRAVFVATAVVLVGAHAVVQWHNAESVRARRERWEWYGKRVAEYLGGAFGKSRPLMAVTAAGCLPYWSGLPAVDMLGLNDRVIARRKPEDFGRGRLGHELGDGDYVLEQRPDIIFFGAPGPGGGREPVFRAGREMVENEEFFREYVPVRVTAETPAPFSVWVWLRWDSDKVGASASENDIALPAYLLNGNPDTVNYLNVDGVPVTLVTPEHPAVLAHLAVPASDWEVVVTPALAHVRGELLPEDEGGYTVYIRATAPTEIQHVTIRRPE